MLHHGIHTFGDHPFTYSVSHKDTVEETKNLKFALIRPKDRIPVECLIMFNAQTSLFFLLVSFSSGLFAAIWPWRPNSPSLLWTVDAEMCLSLELCEAFIWAAIWGAVNSNELILCSRGNYGSSCGGPHERQFHHSAWWFLQLHLKKLSKFFKFSLLTDLHVLK